MIAARATETVQEQPAAHMGDQESRVECNRAIEALHRLIRSAEQMQDGPPVAPGDGALGREPDRLIDRRKSLLRLSETEKRFRATLVRRRQTGLVRQRPVEH